MVRAQASNEANFSFYPPKTLTMTSNLISRPTKTAVFLLLLFASCTTTITRVRNPEFAGPIDSLQVKLNGMVVCEHFNLDGKEITTNGVAKTQLEIEVLNGKNIPEDEARMKSLAHSIAAAIKSALKDGSEFENYTVLFMKVESSTAVTKRSWKGKTFKSTEL